MKKLYFVRHGESLLNAQRIFTGQINTPLSDEGRAQARIAGSMAEQFKFDLIVSSPLVRALETAQLIAEQVGYPLDKIIVNDLFKERYMGSLEGQSWDKGPEDETHYPDMESLVALQARAKAGLAFLNSLDADTILLASHGSLGVALHTVIDPSFIAEEPENARIVQLV